MNFNQKSDEFRKTISDEEQKTKKFKFTGKLSM